MVFSCFGGTPKHATGAVDGAKLDWARRNGFEGTDLEAFTQVARLAQKHQIRSTDLREGEEFDQGQVHVPNTILLKERSHLARRIMF